MSVAQIRAALVAVLNDVPGLSATGYVPATIAPGQAWVVMARALPMTYCDPQAEWFVFVALPAGGNQATVEAGDALIDPVWDALKPVAKVTAVDPWAWQVEAGQAAVPVLRFSVEA